VATSAILKAQSLKSSDSFRTRQEGEDLVTHHRGSCSSIGLRMPEGTFYAFLDIRGLGISSEAAAHRYPERAGVATVPGKAYVPSGEGFLRLSFAVPEAELMAAIQRLIKEVSSDG
jgi:aspartate/methionine/tyrosine aminotransferase